MGRGPGASRLNFSHDSQISAIVDEGHSGPRIEDEETVAGTSMRAICEVVTQTSSTRKDNRTIARGQRTLGAQDR
jgi:hypothetical protein